MSPFEVELKEASADSLDVAQSNLSDTACFYVPSHRGIDVQFQPQVHPRTSGGIRACLYLILGPTHLLVPPIASRCRKRNSCHSQAREKSELDRYYTAVLLWDSTEMMHKSEHSYESCNTFCVPALRLQSAVLLQTSFCTCETEARLYVHQPKNNVAVRMRKYTFVMRKTTTQNSITVLHKQKAPV